MAFPLRRKLILGSLLVLVLAGGGLLAFRELVKARCWAITGPLICRVDTDRPMVALSFDDGPTPPGVDALLPMLARYDAHATFFLIGRDVARNPGLARRISAAGHEIGNHSYTHARMIGVSSAGYRAELERTDALLAREGVPATRLVRPPYGAKFIGLGNAVAAGGKVMVMWDVEEPVVGPGGARAYADAIVRAARPGSILLIHPMYASRAAERAAVPLVLDGLRRRGFRVVSIGELQAAARE